MIFLKNYTSNVPVSQTIGRIEQVLIRCGVTAISKEYSSTVGEIAAITFKIAFDGTQTITVRLPADKDKALEALWMNYVDGDKLNQKGDEIWSNPYKKKRKSDFREQAARTAWKIIQDWVEVQLSMIVMQQADTLEVFMPYVWDGRSTVYQRVKEAGFRTLLPEKCE